MHVYNTTRVDTRCESEDRRSVGVVHKIEEEVHREESESEEAKQLRSQLNHMSGADRYQIRRGNATFVQGLQQEVEHHTTAHTKYLKTM